MQEVLANIQIECQNSLTVGKAVLWAAGELTKAGVDSPRLDAELLVAHVLGEDRAYVFAHPNKELTQRELDELKTCVSRRAMREPLPYITGKREFFKRTFLVSPAVLIPRQETETLVETVLRRVPKKDTPLLILDVGTGSGCIAITLALELPNASIIACDISPEALAVAQRNASSLIAQNPTAVHSGSISFRCTDFPLGLDDIAGRLDVLVSNPPYIANSDSDKLPPEVANYEPRIALFAGEDGLEFIRRIAQSARCLLKPGGLIAMEVGVGQAERVSEMLVQAGIGRIEVTPDLAGIPRVVSGTVA
ncbi:MAG: peptide chain release factor N(5)-glutamine methyltransferase [Armatimonadota bacterium]